MIPKQVNLGLCSESAKMVKSKKNAVPTRKRSSLTNKGNRIVKVTSRPVSGVSTTTTNLPAGNMRVVVRVRPPNHREQEENNRIVVKVIDDQMLVFDPKEDAQGFFFHGVQQRGRDLLKKAHKDLKFIFDKVFSDETTTEEIFKNSTYSLIDSLMDGYNCSVFAYGATGAGKTFTMTGTTEEPGITFLTMTELFRKRTELSIEREFELGITYLEVYNELVKDLLNPGTPLNLREDSTYGVTVAGIKIHKIKSPDELFNLLEQGNKNRTQHPTDANAESSRSHAVFQVYIQMTTKGTKEIRRAKLSMIDLAGSERGSATGYGGARFTEGANINKSLLALGNCINSLADGHRHVPYRDSKLTRLLKDSLGGNCQTVMIANISPSSLSFEDTYNTLKYATRAKKIKSNVKQNVVSMEMHVGQYKKMVEELRSENDRLKQDIDILKQQLEDEAAKDKVVVVNSDQLQLEHDLLKKKLEDICDYGGVQVVINEDVIQEADRLIQSALDLVTREFQLENTKEVSISRRLIKEEIEKIMPKICITTPEADEARRKIHAATTRSRNQECALGVDLDTVEIKLKEIYDRLEEIKEEYPQLRNYINYQKMRISFTRKEYQYEIERKQCEILAEDHKEKLKLMDKMATVLKSTYTQLKGHGFVTSSLTKQYQEIVQTLQGNRRNVTFNNIPDSGISSTTSITGEEDSQVNGNKRKIEEPLNELDGTFTMVTSTPSTTKSKSCTDQIMSKAMRPPPPKRLAPSKFSPRSPRNKENKPFRKPFDTARVLAVARTLTSNKPTGLKGTPKAPTNSLANRPKFRS